MNVQAFLEVLPLAGEGMLGVFATIIVLDRWRCPAQSVWEKEGFIKQRN